MEEVVQRWLVISDIIEQYFVFRIAATGKPLVINAALADSLWHPTLDFFNSAILDDCFADYDVLHLSFLLFVFQKLSLCELLIIIILTLCELSSKFSQFVSY